MRKSLAKARLFNLGERLGDISVLDKFLELDNTFKTIFGTGLFAVISTIGFKSLKSVREHFKLEKERKASNEEDITEIKKSLQTLTKSYKDMNQALIVQERSNVSILHDKVYKNCREYLKRGYVTVEELDNLEYLYSSYKEQGGNGTGDKLYNRVGELEIKEL